MATKTAAPDLARTRDEWLAVTERLASDIEKWATELGWAVARLEGRTITEKGIGSYAAPDLRIKTPHGILDVEVKARRVVGAEGRADLVAFPSLHRMLLVRIGNKWLVKTDAGIDWPRKWGKKTFVELAETLTKTP